MQTAARLNERVGEVKDEVLTAARLPQIKAAVKNICKNVATLVNKLTDTGCAMIDRVTDWDANFTRAFVCGLIEGSIPQRFLVSNVKSVRHLLQKKGDIGLTRNAGKEPCRLFIRFCRGVARGVLTAMIRKKEFKQISDVLARLLNGATTNTERLTACFKLVNKVLQANVPCRPSSSRPHRNLRRASRPTVYSVMSVV